MWEPGETEQCCWTPYPKEGARPPETFLLHLDPSETGAYLALLPPRGFPTYPSLNCSRPGEGGEGTLPAAPGEVWDPLVTRHLGSRVGASVVQTAALEETTGSKHKEVSTKRNSGSLRIPSLNQVDDAGSHHGPHSNGCRWVNEPRVQQENHFLSNVVASSARPVWGSTLLRGFS